jgi:colanic acid/amylovoran biosynthesis glycosyltransferase
VIPDETGWLVPVRDADAFANAIVEVSQTSDIELQRITQNAHDYVKKHFKAEDSIEQFLEMYAEFK